MFGPLKHLHPKSFKLIIKLHINLSMPHFFGLGLEPKKKRDKVLLESGCTFTDIVEIYTLSFINVDT